MEEREEAVDVKTKNYLGQFEAIDKYRPLKQEEARRRFSAAQYGPSQAMGYNLDYDRIRLKLGEDYIETMRETQKIGEKMDKDRLDAAERYTKELERQHEQYVKNADTLRKGELSTLTNLALLSPAKQVSVMTAMMNVRRGIATRSQTETALKFAAPQEKEQMEEWAINRFVNPRLRDVVRQGWTAERRVADQLAEITTKQIEEHRAVTQRMVQEMGKSSERFAKQLESTIDEVIKIHFRVLQNEMTKYRNRKAEEDRKRSIINN